ncbi:mini-chromosome maintenance complex-binding protein [Adelges cooleyi]|uniref:mini-chromosome maintenance complex-binding protein n=1 Tax=Adelges cooleyi TaxID=133065 RepID=UPI002180816F|nr:mini-chromosome maintenance complex-binding protein [Adelges cooleyi]
MDTWTPAYCIDNIDECKRVLLTPGNWEKVPFLLDRQAAVGTLVRFKGMIQDMLNPDYYSKTFSVVNSLTNETKVYQGKFSSAVRSKEDEEIHFGDDLMERLPVACIPIPGLNDWVKNVESSNGLNETELEENFAKRIRLDPTCQKRSNEVFVLIYPEDVDSNELKLNRVVDVIGFYDHQYVNTDDESQEQPLDVKASYCVHAIHIKFQPDPVLCGSQLTEKCIWEEASKIQEELKLVLTQALLGDSLAANYLLFNLVSTIYNRQNNQVPGKFALNIRGIPQDIVVDYTSKLYSLISCLVEKSKYFPITIDNMNNTDLIPRKCYTTNRLLNGFLQLSSKTHLVLDETNLNPGKLENKGMLNLQAINDIISNQQVKYDFMYYTIDYETEISVLTLSNGKSLFPFDIDIVFKPDPSCIGNIEETIGSAQTYLNSQSSLLEKIRKYITIISSMDFNFNEDILKIIENDYVAMRKADPKNVSPDDLHRFMVISKLIALCSGKNELNKEIWESCKALESERKIRNK